MEQTAVEWLAEQLPIYGYSVVRVFPELIEQAKEMEKEQLQLAYASRCSFISCEGNDIEENINCKCGKQYYKETYNR
jgi:hypothetical protein